MLPPAELREMLVRRGVDLARPVAAACGSGISACTLALALQVAALPVDSSVPVYDGSWAEYGANPDNPVEQ
eukprot:m.183044 g.183044  ORF g.183044 m.183044 type:complete len:71 (+) comp21515_c0_seq3:754-966(+)